MGMDGTAWVFLIPSSSNPGLHIKEVTPEILWYSMSVCVVNACFSFDYGILFGSLQQQSKPICLTGTTFLTTVPSDRGNKTHVSCKVCYLN